MNQIILVIILLLAIPTGYLIAYLARDELKQGKSWFRILIISSIIIGIGAYFFGNNVIAFTCGFIFIISLVSLLKSYDKKWTK